MRAARKMWELGHDTFDIADVLELPEATVYAAIGSWFQPVEHEATHG
jgi:hypothetical protein